MPSRAGSPNKDKQAVRELAAQHGVEPLEMMFMMIRDLKKTYDNEVGKPRSRRSQQFFAVEDRLSKLLAETVPYLHGKRANITTVDETPRVTVIRAPKPISDTQAWLEEYGPKRDDTAPVLSFSRNLKQSFDTAEALNVDDANQISIEAKRLTQRG